MTDAPRCYAGPKGFWAIYVRAGRPTAMWVCALVLLVNGAVLPLSRIWGVQIEALDWQGMAVFVTGLIALGAQRSYDKHKGLAT